MQNQRVTPTRTHPCTHTFRRCTANKLKYSNAKWKTDVCVLWKCFMDFPLSWLPHFCNIFTFVGRPHTNILIVLTLSNPTKPPLFSVCDKNACVLCNYIIDKLNFIYEMKICWRKCFTWKRIDPFWNVAVLWSTSNHNQHIGSHFSNIYCVVPEFNARISDKYLARSHFDGTTINFQWKLFKGRSL